MKSSAIDFFDKSVFGESEASTAKYKDTKFDDEDDCPFVEPAEAE